MLLLIRAGWDRRNGTRHFPSFIKLEQDRVQKKKKKALGKIHDWGHIRRKILITKTAKNEP